ncbi:unnamed protein product, partial [Pocillopora meandrina]
GLGPSKLNPVPTIFSFPTHLQPKTRRKRTDPEERRRGALSCIQNKTKTAPRRQADDVLKSNKSVCFYTGLPSYACLMMLFPFLKPFANAMKYWDNKKKGQRETYQEDEHVNKPGPKRQMPLFSEFLMKITWSDYKSHNTFKLLVGISPTGAFTFVSKLWSGGVSDRNITQKSGLIDKLEPLDDVMADRGFNIRDMVTKKKATLNIPPFAKGKSLSTKACTKTRRIAAVRIHVERAIQRLKCFRILRGVIPITLAAVADQTVFVCAALCNLMKPLVSK